MTDVAALAASLRMRHEAAVALLEAAVQMAPPLDAPAARRLHEAVLHELTSPPRYWRGLDTERRVFRAALGLSA